MSASSLDFVLRDARMTDADGFGRDGIVLVLGCGGGGGGGTGGGGGGGGGGGSDEFC